MGLFGIFKNKRYFRRSDLNSGLRHQSEMNSQVLTHLRNFGVADDRRLKLEFFFYTNSILKAHNLAEDLRALDYNVETVDMARGDNKLWVVSGWTKEINMDEASVTEWTTSMRHLGFKHDCEFDGWGTTPNQT